MFLFCFLAALQGLSSPTRDQTPAPCNGSTEFSHCTCHGSPQTRFLRHRSDLVGNESVGLTEFLFRLEGEFVISCFYLPVIGISIVYHGVKRGAGLGVIFRFLELDFHIHMEIKHFLHLSTIQICSRLFKIQLPSFNFSPGPLLLG